VAFDVELSKAGCAMAEYLRQKKGAERSKDNR
jgi:hypothetical protein